MYGNDTFLHRAKSIEKASKKDKYWQNLLKKK